MNSPTPERPRPRYKLEVAPQFQHADLNVRLEQLGDCIREVMTLHFGCEITSQNANLVEGGRGYALSLHSHSITIYLIEDLRNREPDQLTAQRLIVSSPHINIWYEFSHDPHKIQVHDKTGTLRGSYAARYSGDTVTHYGGAVDPIGTAQLLDAIEHYRGILVQIKDSLLKDKTHNRTLEP